MGLVERREEARWLWGHYLVSARRVCGLLVLAESSYRYRSCRSDEGLRVRLLAAAREKPLRGKVWGATFPLRLEIPRMRRDSHFPTATAAAIPLYPGPRLCRKTSSAARRTSYDPLRRVWGHVSTSVFNAEEWGVDETATALI